MNVQTEAVFFYLYDAGRSIDLAKVAQLIPVNAGTIIIKNRRDTPASLTLPVPLIVRLAEREFPGGKPFDRITLDARIFEDGVISIVARVNGKFAVERLHDIRTTPFEYDGTTRHIESWADDEMKLFFAKIQDAITFEQYVFSAFVRESYAAFCITTPIKDPARFVERNRKTFALLLNGAEEDVDLHESVIASAMKGALCYTERDYALFDLDRCLIIDPNHDYEDILLVIEQAIFQLLELRSLDLLLDRWLDKAEDDVKVVFRKNTPRFRRLKVKQESIQALNFDALFILENLENSSKIIGDYFLGQVFDNLCAQFNTGGWKRSIERRLSTLGSVYERVNADANERRMVFLEVMFIVVCIVFPVIQILQIFFLS